MGTDPVAAPSRTARLPLWAVVAFTLALVVLGGLRFARIDLAGTSFFATDNFYTWTTDDGRHVEHLNIDIVQYLAMVEDFRGVEGAFEKHEPYPEFATTDDARLQHGPVEPFTQRVALPWLASLLPIDSSYAFAAVNLALLVFGLWFLVDALAVSGRSVTAQLAGAAMYTFALPVVVFASSLFIDGGVVGVLMLGYWLLARRWWWALVVFIPVSYLVKEALLVLVVPAVWAWRTTGHRFADRRFVTGCAVGAVGVVAAALWAAARAPEAVFSFTVLPTWTFIRVNLTSPVSAVFFVLGVSTVVVPALLAIRHLWRTHGPSAALRGESGADLVGFLTVAAMNAYSIVSTDLTLRTGWLVWPFAIGLGCVWIDEESGLAERLPSVLSGRHAHV